MITAEEVILQHASSRYNPATYDPVKRRERYLRTRQLKGRNPAQKPISGVKPHGQSGTPPKPGPQPDLNEAAKRRRALRQKEIEERVIALTVKLRKLRENLRELARLAKARSGVEPADNQKKSASTKKAEPAGSNTKTERKTQTAAEKKESAERSKEYYEEHKSEMPKSQKIKQLQTDIKVTQQKILRARRYLKTAAANARQEVTTNRPAAQKQPKS